jgi:putative ABC transport system permease protein
VTLPKPSRLAWTDLIRLGALGLTTRRLRAALSALGIALGVATMVVVTGIPASSQHALMDELTALGTNMLRAQPTPREENPVRLPEAAAAMAARIGPVTASAAVELSFPPNRGGLLYAAWLAALVSKSIGDCMPQELWRRRRL